MWSAGFSSFRWLLNGLEFLIKQDRRAKTTPARALFRTPYRPLVFIARKNGDPNCSIILLEEDGPAGGSVRARTFRSVKQLQKQQK